MSWFELYAKFARKTGLSLLIRDRDNNEPYLERFYLIPRWLLLGQGRVVIHRFWKSDDDSGYHDHPWESWGSYILKGGYTELTPDEIFHRKPGDWSGWRTGTDLHKVQLYHEGDEVWTLFFMGKKVRDWGFVPHDTGKWIKWDEYLKLRTKKLNSISKSGK